MIKRMSVERFLCILLIAALLAAVLILFMLLTRRAEYDAGSFVAGVSPHPVAVITMQEGDRIEIELFPECAPNTVANFIALANAGFYNGLTFHRVIPGFLIQGGSPDGGAGGGPGYTIRGEFLKNGVQNPLSHQRGVISMARSDGYDSAGCQFFILLADDTRLDGGYAAFGRVVSGMDAVDAIAEAETDEDDAPLTKQVIASVCVETYDVHYAVEKIGG